MNGESLESKKTKYYVRAIRRFIALILWLFFLFVIVMFIVWAAPKLWKLALA